MRNVLNEMCVIYRTCRFSTNVLFTVQDVCGPVYQWPPYIRKILVAKDFWYAARLRLCTFLWVNGWRNPAGWIELVIALKGIVFRRFARKLADLLEYSKDVAVQRRYFSYCVTHRCYEYLDGTRRHTGRTP